MIGKLETSEHPLANKGRYPQMTSWKIKRGLLKVLNVLDTFFDVLDSPKLTIFAVSLLLIGAILGVILKFMH